MVMIVRRLSDTKVQNAGLILKVRESLLSNFENYRSLL